MLFPQRLNFGGLFIVYSFKFYKVKYLSGFNQGI